MPSKSKRPTQGQMRSVLLTLLKSPDPHEQMAACRIIVASAVANAKRAKAA